MSTEANPLVSVLITAYNREKYIAEAIESVLASTYKNFELIIVDDCSKDNTIKIANDYAEKDGRVKVYVNEKNLGDYPNRNMAASYATGKYLKYVDSDDLISKDGLSVMVAAMEKFQSVAIGMMWVYDDNLKEAKLCTPEMALYEYFINNLWLLVGPSGCIYSTIIFKNSGGFSGKKYVSDFEFNLRMASQYPIVKIRNGLISYRTHDQQQGQEKGHSKTYRIWQYKIQNRILSDEKCPLSVKDKKEALRKIDKLQARRIIFHFFRSFHIKECYKMVVDSDLGVKRFFTGLMTF